MIVFCKPFCKYISSHPTSIFSKLVLLPEALLFTFSISLNKFLLVGIPGMKHLTYVVIVDFILKTCICACYKKTKDTWLSSPQKHLNVFVKLWNLNNYDRSISLVADMDGTDFKLGEPKVQLGQFSTTVKR